MANGLINLQTDLTSLKYSSMPLGSDKPLITKDIGEAPGSQIGTEISRRIDDTSRIAQMLISKPGINYLLHEAELQQIGAEGRIKKARKGGKSVAGAVLGQLGNTVATTLKIVGSTLAQVPVNGTGTHFLKGFRTDTYLQPSGGNNRSKFAQFFGAGGIEGAQYALNGETVPNTIGKGYENFGETNETTGKFNPAPSIFDYNAKVDSNLNEVANVPKPEWASKDFYNSTLSSKGQVVPLGKTEIRPVQARNADTGEVTFLTGFDTPFQQPSLETTATPNVNTKQNLIKSIPHTGSINGDINPDSSTNVGKDRYSYSTSSTGTSTDTAINNAQAGAPIRVVSGSSLQYESTATPRTLGISNKDVVVDVGETSTDNIGTKYSSADTYTGGSTTENIRRAVMTTGSLVRVPIRTGKRNEEDYFRNNSNKQTDGGVRPENLQSVVDVEMQGITLGETSIPKKVSLKTLAYRINTGSADVVSRDGESIDYTPTLQDFRSGSESTLSYNYGLNTINKERRVGLGNQGQGGRTSYVVTDPLSIDKLNQQDISDSRIDGEKPDDVRDLAKFFFEIITPDGSKFLYFRAFLDSVDDSYNATWNPTKYVGRAEEFYTYGGFSRDINVRFKIAAATREEMKPLYKKMVYLASTTAPTYGGQGFMRGTLARLTVGSYFDQLPGVITSVKYNLIDDMPWEIAMQQPEGNESGVQELPMGLECAVAFKVIHDFAPQTGLYHYFSSKEEGKRYFV